jgi:four helix bundle protein
MSERIYDLEERLINYSLIIIDIVETLLNIKAANHLGNQLLRSETSPALNYGEAQAAELLNGFIHKMKIVLKELIESKIALTILYRKQLILNEKSISETVELISIFNKSILTANKRKEN